MDDAGFVSMAIGVGVIVLIAGVGLFVSKPNGTAAEDRLAGLLGGRKVGKPRSKISPAASWRGQPRSTLVVLRFGRGSPQRRKPQPALRTG